ncbi:MAG: VOC family protein [Bacteroidota bacterium]
MKVNFPNDYQQLMPYLMIKDAAGFMQFMSTVFGTTEKTKHLRDDQTVMHAEIKVGECVIMVSEASTEYEATPGSFFIYVADADAIYAHAIEKGATAIMPVADQQYGRSGGVKDPYGNTWWVTTHVG